MSVGAFFGIGAGVRYEWTWLGENKGDSPVSPLDVGLHRESPMVAQRRYR